VDNERLVKVLQLLTLDEFESVLGQPGGYWLQVSSGRTIRWTM